MYNRCIEYVRNFKTRRSSKFHQLSSPILHRLLIIKFEMSHSSKTQFYAWKINFWPTFRRNSLLCVIGERTSVVMIVIRVKNLEKRVYRGGYVILNEKFKNAHSNYGRFSVKRDSTVEIIPPNGWFRKFLQTFLSLPEDRWIFQGLFPRSDQFHQPEFLFVEQC